MTCPDCGYIMGELDKSCLRCAAKDKSSKNPYVAFQNTRNAPADRYAVAPLEMPAPTAPDASAAPVPVCPPVAWTVPASRPYIFWTALLTVLLVLFLYHLAVVTQMQSRIEAQQKQIDDLRDTVNYNANAANMSRY